MILSTPQYSTTAYRQRAALQERSTNLGATPTGTTQTLAQSLGQTFNNVGSATVSISEAALAGLENAGRLLVTGAEDTASAVGHGLEATYEAAKTGVVDLADGIVSGAESAWHLIEGGVSSAISEVDTLAADAASWSGRVASDANSIATGAATASSQIAAGVRNIAAIRGSAAAQTLATIV